MSGHRKPLPARRCRQLTVRYAINCFTRETVRFRRQPFHPASRGNSFCSLTFVFLGVQIPPVRTDTQLVECTSNSARLVKSAVRLRTDPYLYPDFRRPVIVPVEFLIPGKHAGTPVRLLPGCRGYRREKRGNSRWEERRRSPSLMDAFAHPVLPSGLLLNRHSAASRMKKGYGY